MSEEVVRRNIFAQLDDESDGDSVDDVSEVIVETVESSDALKEEVAEAVEEVNKTIRYTIEELLAMAGSGVLFKDDPLPDREFYRLEARLMSKLHNGMTYVPPGRRGGKTRERRKERERTARGRRESDEQVASGWREEGKASIRRHEEHGDEDEGTPEWMQESDFRTERDFGSYTVKDIEREKLEYRMAHGGPTEREEAERLREELRRELEEPEILGPKEPEGPVPDSSDAQFAVSSGSGSLDRGFMDNLLNKGEPKHAAGESSKFDGLFQQRTPKTAPIQTAPIQASPSQTRLRSQPQMSTGSPVHQSFPPGLVPQSAPSGSQQFPPGLQIPQGAPPPGLQGIPGGFPRLTSRNLSAQQNMPQFPPGIPPPPPELLELIRQGKLPPLPGMPQQQQRQQQQQQQQQQPPPQTRGGSLPPPDQLPPHLRNIFFQLQAQLGQYQRSGQLPPPQLLNQMQQFQDLVRQFVMSRR